MVSDDTIAFFYKEVGQRIRKARANRGLTQQALASFVSLTRVSITNIESGRQKILLHKCAEIATALDVPPADLLPRNTLEQAPDIDEHLPDDTSENVRNWVKSIVN